MMTSVSPTTPTRRNAVSLGGEQYVYRVWIERETRSGNVWYVVRDTSGRAKEGSWGGVGGGGVEAGEVEY